MISYKNTVIDGLVISLKHAVGSKIFRHPGEMTLKFAEAQLFRVKASAPQPNSSLSDTS